MRKGQRHLPATLSPDICNAEVGTNVKQLKEESQHMDSVLEEAVDDIQSNEVEEMLSSAASWHETDMLLSNTLTRPLPRMRRPQRRRPMSRKMLHAG